jgi:hypothetical protein
MMLVSEYQAVLGGAAFWINLSGWLVAAYEVFRGAFLGIDRLNMSNDLINWSVRIIGSIVILVGFAAVVGSLMAYAENPSPIPNTPTFLFSLGVFLAGCFSVYRANRREDHLYINTKSRK